MLRLMKRFLCVELMITIARSKRLMTLSFVHPVITNIVLMTSLAQNVAPGNTKKTGAVNVASQLIFALATLVQYVASTLIFASALFAKIAMSLKKTVYAIK